MSQTILHHMTNGFCITCNETDDWLQEHEGIMAPANTVTSLQVGEIVRQGNGKRRWAVTKVDATGRVTLGKLAGKGEQAHALGVYPNVRFDGFISGGGSRYLGSDDQGDLTRLGKLTPLPYGHPSNEKQRSMYA